MPEVETVFIIDDDEAVRVGLARLLRASGLNVRTFSSALMYLNERPPNAAGCVVLDLSLPELNGFDLQANLAREPEALPVIFLTAYGDVPSSVQAMKGGAVDFLLKPVDEKILLAAVTLAFTRDRERRARALERARIRELLSRISPREHDVMRLLVTGRLNKQIGAELGMAEKTVKVHRAHLFQKLGIISVAELVRFFVQTEADSARAPDLPPKKPSQSGSDRSLAADIHG